MGYPLPHPQYKCQAVRWTGVAVDLGFWPQRYNYIRDQRTWSPMRSVHGPLLAVQAASFQQQA